MFSECTELNTFDLDFFTSNLIDMSYLFHNCKSLTNINFNSNWKGENVKNMSN